MAAIQWADVSGCFPELASTPVLFQMIALAIVNGAGLNAENFGGEDAALTQSARVFLAGHLATLQKRQGVGGAVSSQSEGGASQSYWMGFTSPRLLHLTSQGQMLVQLIMGTPARAGTLV